MCVTRGAELALLVLEEQGIIEKSGSWWRFKEGLPVEVRAMQQEPVNAMVVSPGRLPWLEVREVANGDYMPTTKQGRVFCALKMAMGMDWKDRAYDKAMYARSARALNQLLDAFSNEQECAEFVLSFGDDMREAGIASWGIDAVVRKAYNTKGQREQMK